MLTNLIVLTFLNIYAYQIITLYALPRVICQLDLNRAAVGGDPKTDELSVGLGVVLWASLYNFYATSALKNPLIAASLKLIILTYTPKSSQNNCFRKKVPIGSY